MTSHVNRPLADREGCFLHGLRQGRVRMDAQLHVGELPGAACEAHLKSSTSVVQPPAEASPLNAKLSAYRAQSGKQPREVAF